MKTEINVAEMQLSVAAVRVLLLDICALTTNTEIHERLEEADMRLFNLLLDSGWEA